MNDPLSRKAAFSRDDRELVELYASMGVPLDELPYTDQFDKIVGSLLQTADPTDDDRRKVFHRLLVQRKSGRLPRLGPRPRRKEFDLSELHSPLLKLVEDEIGSIGRRDTLPYTEAFERIYAALSSFTSQVPTRSRVWKEILRISKPGDDRHSSTP